MNAHEVAVIDYGMGNLLSVRRAIEYCGGTVTVTSDPGLILSAKKVVLPGVGSFVDGMTELHRRKLDIVVQDLAAQGTPLLGICLGMQMLLDQSEEFGTTKGLGLIPGRVVSIPARTLEGYPQKIPHIGWNELVFSQEHKNWESTLLQKVKLGEAVYFVHSFMTVPNSAKHRIADCLYGGIPVSAVIERENIFGCQFHPEKSGQVGLKVLQRFLEL